MKKKVAKLCKIQLTSIKSLRSSTKYLWIVVFEASKQSWYSFFAFSAFNRASVYLFLRCTKKTHQKLKLSCETFCSPSALPFRSLWISCCVRVSLSVCSVESWRVALQQLAVSSRLRGSPTDIRGKFSSSCAALEVPEEFPREFHSQLRGISCRSVGNRRKLFGGAELVGSSRDRLRSRDLVRVILSVGWVAANMRRKKTSATVHVCAKKKIFNLFKSN